MKFIVQVATVFHARNEGEDDKWIWNMQVWAWWNYNKQNNEKLTNKTQQSRTKQKQHEVTKPSVM